MSDNLTIQFKSQLVDALLNCHSINDKEVRTSLINDLPDDIKNSIPRHSSNRVEMKNIVDRCLDFSAGIENLIKVVRIFEGDSDSMRKVYDIIPSILGLESPISNQYLSELFFILEKLFVQFSHLQTFYRKSLPPFFKNHSEPKSSWQMITELSKFPLQADKTHPLVYFIQNIVDKLSPGKESDQLADWISRIAVDFGIVSEKEISSSKACGHDINESPVYLLVHLRPDPNNRNNEHQEFAVNIYSWRNPDDVPCVYTHGQCDKNKILDIIDDVIETKFDENDNIQAIEFILPCQWIHLDVNEWKRNDEIEWNSRLIDDYQVSVRLDRYHYKGKRLKRRFRDRWKKKWNRFKTMNADQCANTSIFWVCNHENYDVKKLCSEFTYDEDKTCLMQTFLPQHPDDFGLALLNAGIPVAVWCKKYGHLKNDHEIIKNDLFELIKDGNLIMLPDRIHKVCRKPEQKKRLQDHLTLLWDDPGRLPKDLQESQHF